MITYSMVYVQSSFDFFRAQQDAVYGLIEVPADQETIRDLQHLYWMGGEL